MTGSRVEVVAVRTGDGGPAVEARVTDDAGPAARRSRLARLLAGPDAEVPTRVVVVTTFDISAGTAKTHVANNQGKLGARNRVGIAAWAWEAGLMAAGS